MVGYKPTQSGTVDTYIVLDGCHPPLARVYMRKYVFIVVSGERDEI